MGGDPRQPADPGGLPAVPHRHPADPRLTPPAEGRGRPGGGTCEHGDDPDGTFGTWLPGAELGLSEAIERGVLAGFEIDVLEVRDPELHAAMTSTSDGTGSPAVRGARLAAVQTGLMRAAVEERFRRVLSFHSRIGEAEAMAAGVPAVAARFAEDDPDTFPPAERVWAEWLYGEHPPLHRRQVLDEFASDFLRGDGFEGHDIPAALRVLSSVRVLGEGVDTAECDAVLFADARGSMVDIVQMVGRALRMQPGAGRPRPRSWDEGRVRLRFRQA